MNFAFTEEQEQLRQFVRSFLEDKSSEAAVREQMDTEKGYDDAVWSQMAEQLGLQSLIVPEEHGGQGFTFVELGVVLEEMGRSLLCAPFFSGVLATCALLNASDDEAKAAHLPGIASGETIRHPGPSPRRTASGTRAASPWRRRPTVTATPCRGSSPS